MIDFFGANKEGEKTAFIYYDPKIGSVGRQIFSEGKTQLCLVGRVGFF